LHIIQRHLSVLKARIEQQGFTLDFQILDIQSRLDRFFYEIRDPLCKYRMQYIEWRLFLLQQFELYFALGIIE
jgi:hypothetical protein